MAGKVRNMVNRHGRYHALKDALTRMVAQPFERAGTDADTEVIRALGEVGGIWPVSVLGDAERNAAV